MDREMSIVSLGEREVFLVDGVRSMVSAKEAREALLGMEAGDMRLGEGVPMERWQALLDRHDALEAIRLDQERAARGLKWHGEEGEWPGPEADKDYKRAAAEAGMYDISDEEYVKEMARLRSGEGR